MEKFIPLSIPNFEGNERKYVDDAIDQGWVSTGGAYITKLEQSMASFLHVENVAACQSGTSALHLALVEAGVKPKDVVLVPPLTFIAAVNPVKYQFATPVFIDCDDSFCMDPVKLRSFCEEECDWDGERLKHHGAVVRALVVVHVFGNMADMESIMEIAGKYHIKVIEDATEALGTRYIEKNVASQKPSAYAKQHQDIDLNKPISKELNSQPYEYPEQYSINGCFGKSADKSTDKSTDKTSNNFAGKYAGTIADFGCYSFNGNKIITTGGGGAITANNPKTVDHLRFLSTQAKTDPHYYIHDEIGYNYRMTNLQAALGVAQMEELPEFIKRKQKNYERYKELLADFPYAKLMPFREGTESNKWFYSVEINRDYVKASMREIILACRDRGFETRAIWGLINEQKPYVNEETYRLEKAPYYANRILNIPSSTQITEEEIEYVAKELKELLGSLANG